jgi:hypothetical protein
MIPFVTPSSTSGIEQLALIMYFFLFIGSFDGYATGVSNLRTAVFEYQAR